MSTRASNLFRSFSLLIAFTVVITACASQGGGGTRPRHRAAGQGQQTSRVRFRQWPEARGRPDVRDSAGAVGRRMGPAQLLHRDSRGERGDERRPRSFQPRNQATRRCHTRRLVTLFASTKPDPAAAAHMDLPPEKRVAAVTGATDR